MNIRQWIGTTIIVLCGILLVAILSTELNTKQVQYKITKMNEETAKLRYEAAEVELDNTKYRQWVYGILYKDIEHKDDWKQEVETLKQENGYYQSN